MRTKGEIKCEIDIMSVRETDCSISIKSHHVIGPIDNPELADGLEGSITAYRQQTKTTKMQYNVRVQMQAITAASPSQTRDRIQHRRTGNRDACRFLSRLPSPPHQSVACRVCSVLQCDKPHRNTCLRPFPSLAFSFPPAPSSRKNP